MEITSVTRLSVENMEVVDHRISRITKLTLSIESRTSGKHRLVLIEPFPPFGRPGTDLARLKSLERENIESVCVPPASTNERSPWDAAVEITTAAGETAIFRCKEVQNLPDCVDLTR